MLKYLKITCITKGTHLDFFNFYRKLKLDQNKRKITTFFQNTKEAKLCGIKRKVVKSHKDGVQIAKLSQIRVKFKNIYHRKN